MCTYVPAHFLRAVRLPVVGVGSLTDSSPVGHMILPPSPTPQHTPTFTSPPVTSTPTSGIDGSISPTNRPKNNIHGRVHFQLSCYIHMLVSDCKHVVLCKPCRYGCQTGGLCSNKYCKHSTSVTVVQPRHRKLF